MKKFFNGRGFGMGFLTHYAFALLTFCLTAWISPPVTAEESPFVINGQPVPEVIADVNGVPLHSPMLRNQVQTFRLLSKQEGKPVTPEVETAFARDALNKLVDQELLYQKRKDWNIDVAAQTVDQEIAKIREQFSSETLFKTALQIQGLDLDLLKISIEKQLVEGEIARTQLAPKVNVSDADVKAYYENNPGHFRHPAQYALSHIFVAALKSSPQEEPQDPKLRERARKLNQMVEADAQDKIEMVSQRLQNGESFEDLAREFSEHEESRQKDGEWGVMTPQDLPEEILNIVSKMKSGETSGVVRTQFGFHILKLRDHTPEGLVAMDKVKTDILNLLLKQEVEKAREQLLAELRKQAKIKLYF